MKNLIMMATIVAAFVVSPAFAAEVVVVPDHRGTTTIPANDRRSDGPVIVEKGRPDAGLVEHDRHYSNGASTGDVGVDVETHGHDHDRP